MCHGKCPVSDYSLIPVHCDVKNILSICHLHFSNISADDMLYTETDLEESMDKIETINFHEVKEVAGIKFWCYHAGHVLGAAMFMIEIAGVKVRSGLGPFFPGGVSAELLAPGRRRNFLRLAEGQNTIMGKAKSLLIL